MATLLLDSDTTANNPLDIAEQIINSREWVCDRPIDDELIAEVQGHWCNYRLWLTWQPDLEGMMFSCAYDVKITNHAQPAMYKLLALMNERLWLGHFDMCSEDGTITFRHGMLLKGFGGMGAAQMEELVDIAVEECERFYPAFQSVLWGGQTPEDAIKFAMLETLGEA